jgi:hypothetical protein
MHQIYRYFWSEGLKDETATRFCNHISKVKQEENDACYQCWCDGYWSKDADKMTRGWRIVKRNDSIIIKVLVSHLIQFNLI